MRKCNFGISLISLIITIIVIIILAAFVYWMGLDTPDRASFAKFTSEFSDFNLAVDNDYMKRYADYAVKGETRSKAQIYYEIASGVDVGRDGTPKAEDELSGLGIVTLPAGLEGKEYYLVTSDTNVSGWDKDRTYYEATEKHYITDEGEAFVLPGYLVESNGEQQWWVNESKYYVGSKVVPEEDLALWYEVVNKNGYSVIRLYPRIKASETYGDYAAKILYGKSDAEIEQMFVEGNNYWNEKEGWGEPNYSNIDELIDYWNENYCDGNVINVETLCSYYGYSNLAEFAIDWLRVKPEGYDSDTEQIAIDYSIYSEKDDATIVSSSTYMPYVEYECFESGTYPFTLITDEGEVKVNVKVEIGEIGEIDYTQIFITDGNGTILGLKSKYYSDYDGNCHYTSRLNSIEIPSNVGSEIITAIGDEAFAHILGIESIVLLGNIETIGEGAFLDCPDLISITLCDGVKSIGFMAFEGCFSLENISIPSSVTSIGVRAFDSCSSLTSIVIPNGVTSIEGSTFNGCSSLTNVIIPDSVVNIEWSAFRECSSLTSVTIPSSVTSIATDTFGSCYSLTKITIESGSTLTVPSDKWGATNATIVQE